MEKIPVHETDIRRQVEDVSKTSYWEQILCTAKAMLLHIQERDLNGVVVFNYDGPEQLSEDQAARRVPAVCISSDLAHRYNSEIDQILENVTRKDIIGIFRFLDIPMKDGSRGGIQHTLFSKKSIVKNTCFLIIMRLKKKRKSSHKISTWKIGIYSMALS